MHFPNFQFARRHGRIASAHGRTRPWSACSPHHLLRFRRSLFVLLGGCFERIVGALFVAKVSFCLNPFGRMVAEISLHSAPPKRRALSNHPKRPTDC